MNNNSINMPRIVIAGTHSGAGKTSLTLGLIRALKQRCRRVQPFKVGPDYIDPGWHSAAAGRPSHNLDSWMGSSEVLMDIFARHAVQADLSVIEGVMGLYDGARLEGLRGSTAEVATLLNAPVVLVMNGRGLGYSSLAMLQGYRDFMPSLNLAGIIINQAGDYHRDILAPMIEKDWGMPVLGCVPRCSGIELPERHLGLLPADEQNAHHEIIATMADLVEKYIDMDRLEVVAASATPWPRPLAIRKSGEAEVIVAVARDEAFSFYYQDNLDYLRESGAELRFFSPLHEQVLPEAHGLMLGGGFPEMFLPELAGNGEMSAALRKAIEGGLPVWAECGGYMYLCDSIEDFNGKCWPGLGIIPRQSRMGRKLAGLGYRRAYAVNDSPLALKEETLTGHEFHYSFMNEAEAPRPAYAFTRAGGSDSWMDGFATPQICASYLHIHLRSNPQAARRFVEVCSTYKNRTQKVC